MLLRSWFFVIWIEQIGSHYSVFENLSPLPPLAVQFHGTLYEINTEAPAAKKTSVKVPDAPTTSTILCDVIRVMYRAINPEVAIFFHGVHTIIFLFTLRNHLYWMLT